MASVTINGVTYQGRSVSVRNSKVFIDGKEVGTDEEKTINIEVHGDLTDLDVASCQKLQVSGNVLGSIEVKAGDIRCGNVQGDVSTMSGDIHCGEVGGKVSTMSGDIHHAVRTGNR